MKNKKRGFLIKKTYDGKEGERREIKKISESQIPTLQLKTDHDIAMDFAVKAYKKFDKSIKSIVLFGSVAKNETVLASDIDIIIIIDDCSIRWDIELIAWYREELDKLLAVNPYKKSLHINTVRLSTWWEDLMKGDPVVLNVLRYGETMIDMGGFFTPLKFLLETGKIKATPEAIYSCLQRAPLHIAQSKASELNVVEGLYWAMTDAAQAALIAAKRLPPSPEHIPIYLKENLVDKGKLKMQYVSWYRDILVLHKQITHGEIRDLKHVNIDQLQDRTDEFLSVMAKLVNALIDEEKL